MVQLADTVFLSDRMVGHLWVPNTNWSVLVALAESIERSISGVKSNDLPNPAAALLLGGIKGPLIFLTLDIRTIAEQKVVTPQEIRNLRNQALQISQSGLRGDQWLRDLIHAYATSDEIEEVKKALIVFAGKPLGLG